VREGNVVGFIFNPLLWLVAFLLCYLLLGNVFVSDIAVYSFFNLEYYSGVVNESIIKSLIFYFVILFFYGLSKDSSLYFKGVVYLSLSYKNVVLFMGVILSLYFLIIVYVAYLNILPLRGVDRVAAFSAYIDKVWIYKYGVFLNLAFLYLFFSMLMKNYAVNRYIAVVVVLAILFVDYTHGGRSVTLRIGILLYLMMVLRTGRLYIIHIVTFVSFIALLGLFQRGADFEGLSSLYVLFGEFVLTRSTSDIVLSLNLGGDPSQPFICFIFSILPGVVRDYFSVDSCFLGGVIQHETGLSFGLASNLLTESIYYFGDYYFISAFIMGLYFYLLNRYAYRFGFFGLLLLVLVITSIQDVARTSFYDFGLVIIYLLCSYYLMFILLFHKKKLLRVG